jgi:hypothetical protein
LGGVGIFTKIQKCLKNKFFGGRKMGILELKVCGENWEESGLVLLNKEGIIN